MTWKKGQSGSVESQMVREGQYVEIDPRINLNTLRQQVRDDLAALTNDQVWEVIGLAVKDTQGSPNA